MKTKKKISKKQQEAEHIKREQLRAKRREQHERYLATLPPLEERQKRKRERREYGEKIAGLIGNTERKIGRLLTFREMDHRQLVMAKHEDDPKVRSAWLGTVIHKKRKAIIFVNITNSRTIKVVAKATSDGALVDENGKSIQVWEYMNLDGTPFKRSIKEPKQ